MTIISSLRKLRWCFTTCALVLLFVSCNGKLLGSKSPSEIQLAIQPLGEMEASLLDSVQTAIHASYGFKVIILPTVALPNDAFINVKSPRYRADILLTFLQSNKPDSVDYILGLTAKDISTTKHDEHGEIMLPKSRYEDWGVFGLGQRPGPACVISTFRINNPSRALFIERLGKVCLHEIGHNLGLPHCEKGERCVMRDAAETIKTVDNVDASLCKDCRESID